MAKIIEFINVIHKEDLNCSLSKKRGLTYSVFSCKSFTKKKNEDCLLLIELENSMSVLAVADGVGGLEKGDMASRIVVQELKKELVGNSNLDQEFLCDNIMRAFDIADQKIRESCSGAASTVSVAVIRGSQLRSYHVGDSEVLILKKNGNLKFRTFSHSPMAEALKFGLIDEREYFFSPLRHIISNAIGIAPMRIEVGPVVDLIDSDSVIVATDGITDNIFLMDLERLAGRNQQDCLSDLILNYVLNMWDQGVGKMDDTSLITAHFEKKAG